MATFTFGSVGDIITISNIIIQGSRALSKSKGSTADYQSLIRELSCLAELLETIKASLEGDIELKHQNRLKEIVESCEEYFKKYTEDIKPFQSSLGANPSDKAIKRIYRKLRWLSKAEDVTVFHRSIAMYVSSIAGILTLSGIDLMLRCHNLTATQIAQGLVNVQQSIAELRSEQTETNARMLIAIENNGKDILHTNQTVMVSKAEQIAKSANVLAAIQKDGQALVIHNRTENQILHEVHADICARFSQLELAVASKNLQEGNKNLAVIDLELLESNKIILRQVFTLVMELSKLGLTCAYTLLQLLRCFLLKTPIPAKLQASGFFFEDALLRRSFIDPNFISCKSPISAACLHINLVDNFTKIIASKLLYLADPFLIGTWNFIHPKGMKIEGLNLADIWNNKLLNGQVVFMRIVIHEVYARDGAIVRYCCPAHVQENPKSYMSNYLHSSITYGLETPVLHSSSIATNSRSTQGVQKKFGLTEVSVAVTFFNLQEASDSETWIWKRRSISPAHKWAMVDTQTREDICQPHRYPHRLTIEQV